MYVGDTKTIAGLYMITAVLRQLAGWMAGNFRKWLSLLFAPASPSDGLRRY